MPERLTTWQDDDRKDFCASQGIDVDDHCCLDLAWFCSKPEEWQGQGTNPVILYLRSWREYRIEISRDGHAATPIHYCPWCGTRLPESLEDVWFETLVEMGYDDPTEQTIPGEFQTDVWWKARGL